MTAAPIHPDDQAEQERARRGHGLDIRPSGWEHLRPEPEAAPSPPQRPVGDGGTARRGLATARAVLAGWTVSDHPVGVCALASCGLPCATTDPAGVVRHVMCGAVA